MDIDSGIQLAKGESLAKAYHEALVKLNDNGKIYDCDAYSNKYIKKVQKEISLAMYVKNINKGPFISKFLLCGPEALQDYELELLYGVRDFNVDAYEQGLEGNFWPYTYHQRIEQGNQVDFVIDDLLRDKETRRAVILTRDNYSDMHVNDPACLQEFIFNIRDNKLNMTTVMRSNDATQASGMNMYGFIQFQKMVLKKLKEEVFKRINVETNKDELKRLKTYLKIEPGSYTHVAPSFHAYGNLVDEETYRNYLLENEGITLEEDIKNGDAIAYKDGFIIGEIRRLKKNVSRIKKNKLNDLVYPYEGEYGWESMMHKRICPFLAELAIDKCQEYDLFDNGQAKKIDEILNDYDITYEELNDECLKRGIDLFWLYGKANHQIDINLRKIKGKN